MGCYSNDDGSISIPPGKRPVVPVFTSLPRYQPSPKPSSSSTSSIFSPRRRVSSSGPLALKSSRGTGHSGQMRSANRRGSPRGKFTHGQPRENHRGEECPPAVGGSYFVRWSQITEIVGEDPSGTTIGSTEQGSKSNPRNRGRGLGWEDMGAALTGQGQRQKRMKNRVENARKKRKATEHTRLGWLKEIKRDSSGAALGSGIQNPTGAPTSASNRTTTTTEKTGGTNARSR